MRRLRQILVLPTSGLRSVQLSLTWLLARDLGPISVIRPSLLVRIDISKTHEPAFGCNHYSRALVIHLADHRRIVSPSHVGGGTIDVVEELGLHSVHALAVVLRGHRYAQDQPQDEADAGKEEASGEPGRP